LSANWPKIELTALWTVTRAVEKLQLRPTFPDKPSIKTYVALWKSCRSIAPLQLSFLENFNLVGTFWSYAILKQAKWNEKRPEHRNARPRSASRGHPALAFAPGPYTVIVAGPRARTVPRPCGPAHLDTGQVAIAREPPSAPPVTRAGRRTSKPLLPSSWTRQLVPRANGTFFGSPPPRIPLLIRRQNEQQSRMTFSSVPPSSMVVASKLLFSCYTIPSTPSLRHAGAPGVAHCPA
jgi:hypothetical protein